MLDRFHKISEIIAAFAIVGSLVFVGIQLNQNTSALLVDSQQSAMAAWNDISLAIATNERLAGLISESRYPEFKAAEAGGSESRQALTFITASMNSIENQYLQYLDGILPEEIWNGFRSGLLSELITLEIYSEYWSFAKNFHSPRFQTLVEELMLIADEQRRQYRERTGFNEAE